LSPVGRHALAWGLALLALSQGVGCREPASDRVRGWPPSPDERARLAASAAPTDATASGLATADGGGADASGGVATEAPDGVGAVLPCAQLVALACELYGSHDDHCREAQARPPDDSHGPTREACAELLGRVQETEVARGTACNRYVKALCAVHGQGSERCGSARSTAGLARTRREQRICQGDWLLLESRLFRR
jgi:hypothetical protein